MGLLSQLGEWLNALASFVPRLKIVRLNERGIKFRRGREVVTMGPGLHWYWPLVTEVESVFVCSQSVDIPHQALLVCKEPGGDDYVSVVASATILYRIVDVEAFLVENWQAEQNLAEVAAAFIRRVLVESDLETIQSCHDEIDRHLLESLSGALGRFGIQVDSARLSNFTLSRALTLVPLRQATPAIREVPL